MQERVGRGGGLTAPTTQEKSLLHIRKSSQSVEPSGIPSDINPEKVFYVTGECDLPLCLVILSVTLLCYGEYVLKVLKYSGFELQALYCTLNAFDLNCEFVNLMDLHTNQWKKYQVNAFCQISVCYQNKEFIVFLGYLINLNVVLVIHRWMTRLLTPYTRVECRPSRDPLPAGPEPTKRLHQEAAVRSQPLPASTVQPQVGVTADRLLEKPHLPAG